DTVVDGDLSGYLLQLERNPTLDKRCELAQRGHYLWVSVIAFRKLHGPSRPENRNKQLHRGGLVCADYSRLLLLSAFSSRSPYLSSRLPPLSRRASRPRWRRKRSITPCSSVLPASPAAV